jgi:hypothetical protein
VAERFRKTSECPVANSVTPSDRVVVYANTSGTPNTFTVSIGNLFGNSSANVVIQTIAAPANSTVTTVRAGTLLTDGSYLYVATSNNVLKRVAISSF